MWIYLGADHRGYRLKEKLRPWLSSLGYEVSDLGNTRYDPDDDFPDFALAVAEAVARGEGLGILICGSGGMALVANKVRGIRAVEVFDPESASHAKSHDQANVIALPADALNVSQAKQTVRAFLVSQVKREEKYQRRLMKIAQIERRYFK